MQLLQNICVEDDADSLDNVERWAVMKPVRSSVCDKKG